MASSGAEWSEAWVQLYRNDKDSYYWNRRTGATTYEKVDAMWQGKTDQVTGRWYFWKPGTSESVWWLPELSGRSSASQLEPTDLVQEDAKQSELSTQSNPGQESQYISQTMVKLEQLPAGSPSLKVASFDLKPFLNGLFCTEAKAIPGFPRCFTFRLCDVEQVYRASLVALLNIPLRKPQGPECYMASLNDHLGKAFLNHVFAFLWGEPGEPRQLGGTHRAGLSLEFVEHRPQYDRWGDNFDYDLQEAEPDKVLAIDWFETGLWISIHIADEFYQQFRLKETSDMCRFIEHHVEVSFDTFEHDRYLFFGTWSSEDFPTVARVSVSVDGILCHPFDRSTQWLDRSTQWSHPSSLEVDRVSFGPRRGGSGGHVQVSARAEFCDCDERMPFAMHDFVAYTSVQAHPASPAGPTIDHGISSMSLPLHASEPRNSDRAIGAAWQRRGCDESDGLRYGQRDREWNPGSWWTWHSWWPAEPHNSDHGMHRWENTNHLTQWLHHGRQGSEWSHGSWRAQHSRWQTR